MADEYKEIIPDPVLSAFVEQQKAKEVEKPATPVEGQTAVPKPTEEPSKPVAEAAPKEPEKVQEKQQPAPEQVAAPVTSWDAGETIAETKPTSTPFDFSKLGSALELGEVKDETEFIGKVSELKSKLKQSQEAPYQGVPDDFKELIEVTKKTGDWKTYLAETIVDYTKISPLKLYEENAFSELSKLQRFKNGDGSIKEQEIMDEIATVPEITRMVEGSRQQRQLIDQQIARKNALVNAAKERQIGKEKELLNSTKDLNQILPYESYGIKFEPKHSNAIYEGVLTSKLTKKHLGVTYEDLVRSGADMKSIARTIASAEYGEQMLKFKSNAANVQAKKEILAKVENAQLTTPAVAAAPESKDNKTPFEKYKEQLLKQRNSF